MDKQESLRKPNSQTEEEKKIPVFTVLKNGAILKNIFLLDDPPAITTTSVEEAKLFEEILAVGRHQDFHGSWISGNKIEPGVQVELKEGDKMKLGGSSREYDSCSMRLKKNGKMVEVEHPKTFEKEKLISQVLEEHKSANVVSRNKARTAVTVLKNQTDRVPFQSLVVNSPNNTNSKSLGQKVKLNANHIECPEIMEASPYSVSSLTSF
ncbi:hypothetical protein HAX54_001698 [Datura stramonium]|uniref:Uncharacterized protein n=1 Tax=Datura stramonium TaxID=4076 RepID=A0ABS8WUK7_DATST|nr:hypothetical protein [Datura stramonium]